MKPFDPASLGVTQREWDAAVAADPSLADRWGLEAGRAEGVGYLDITDADLGVGGPGPIVLEFALSRDGEILRHHAFAAECPPGVEEWAWTAYLEGIIAAANGQSAVTVSEQQRRLLGSGGEWEGDEDEEEYDEDEGWTDEDEEEHRHSLDPHDPEFVPRPEPLPF